MVRKVTTKIEETQDSDSQPEAIHPEADSGLSQSEQELTEFFESIGASANLIRIYKVVNGESQFCGSAEPSVVSLEYILANYRGGKYRLQACMNGRIVAGGTRYVTVYDPPFDPAKAMQQSAQSQAPSNEISILREQLNRQQELMMQIITSNNGSDKRDIVELLQVLQAIQPKQPDIMATLPSIMDLFKSSMELAKDTAGSGEKTNWLDFAAKALDKLPIMVQGIMQANQNRAAQARQPETGPHPIAASPPCADSLIAPDATTEINQLLRKGIAACKPYVTKADPEQIVDWIMLHIDDTTDPMYRNLAIGILNRTFDEIAELDAELKLEPAKTWFVKLHSELRKAMQGNDESETIAG